MMNVSIMFQIVTLMRTQRVDYNYLFQVKQIVITYRRDGKQ